MKENSNNQQGENKELKVCPFCGSNNLATIKRGFYALGVYFPTSNEEKKCLSCKKEFNSNNPALKS